jgi:HK97 family phage major capsid protein
MPELHEIASSIQTSVQGLSTKFDTKMAALQTQVDAIDARGADQLHAHVSTKSVKTILEESDQFQRLVSDRRGRATLTLTAENAPHMFQRKTTITSSGVGWMTTGVLPIERIPEITTEARRRLVVRDALYARPTTFQVVDFVKVTSPMTIASPVAEASLKPENAVTFASTSERVKTIATWIPASKQILEDMTELAGFLQTSLSFYVDLAEEIQLLSGDGTGENLHGLIPQASAFSAALLTPAAGWTRLDIIGRAIQQLMAASELPPTFVILHPNDWWALRLTKDAYGRYIIGDPQAGQDVPKLFDLDVIPTPSIAAGQFLIGSGDPAASEIRDRMQLQVEVSTEHQDYFVKNLVAVRAEKRLALVTKRPGSYVAGTLNSSPVS